ncbi:MAG TPA: hypothetical protein DDX91_07340 [Ruminococcaceae bacterium]|nr:hypothetical protein [Oscillospiraceae bacterium]
MADFRRLAVAGHENVTQSSVEYAEKMRANSYVDRFSYLLYFCVRTIPVRGLLLVLVLPAAQKPYRKNICTVLILA